MSTFTSAFPILHNVFIPSERLWVKNKVTVMKWLRTLSLMVLSGWFASSTTLHFIISGLPEVAEQLKVIDDWVTYGLVYGFAAAVLAHISTHRGFWVTQTKRLYFGKSHKNFVNKVAQKPVIIRSLERILFILHISAVLLLIGLSFAPRGIMTLYNFGLLG